LQSSKKYGKIKGKFNHSPMNTVFANKLLALTTLAITLLNTTMIGHVYADCLPSPTIGDDTISCSGTSTNVNNGITFDTFGGSDTLSNIVGGLINMAVDLGAGIDFLFNEGAINNTLSFGDGNDTYTYGNVAGNDGTIDGYIWMHGGDDTLVIDKDFNPTTKFNGFSIIDFTGADTFTINPGVTVTGGVSLGYIFYDSASEGVNQVNTLNNDGTITGAVQLGTGVDNLFNVGSIGNYVGFGSGNDVYTYGNDVGNDGTIDGYIYMEAGDDTLVIDKDFNPTTKFNGFSIIDFTGADTFTINPGVTVTGGVSLANITADSISEGANQVNTLNNDGAITGAVQLGTGVDVLLNTGSIGNYVGFGSGNDIYMYGNTVGNDGTIDGYIYMEAGDDTLVIDKDFNPTNKFNGFSILDFSGEDTFTINPGVTVTGGVSLANITADSVTEGANQVNTLNNDGTITGAVQLGTGVDNLFNVGSIGNYVGFGSGNDVYTYGNDVGNDGTIDGYIQME
jgi:hypothetical protein